MIMKRILSTAAAMAVCFAAVADDGSPESSNFRFMWGPKAGIGFFVPEKWSTTRNSDHHLPGFGCAAGIDTRFEWRSRWYVEPALMISYGGSSMPVYYGREGTDEIYRGDYDMMRGAVEIPVHMGYKFHVHGDYYMSAFTGGMVSYGFAGSLDAPSGCPHMSLYGDNGVWNRVSYAVALGFTVESASPVVFSLDFYAGMNQMARRNIFRTARVNECEMRVSFMYRIR